MSCRTCRRYTYSRCNANKWIIDIRLNNVGAYGQESILSLCCSAVFQGMSLKAWLRQTNYWIVNVQLLFCLVKLWTKKVLFCRRKLICLVCYCEWCLNMGLVYTSCGLKISQGAQKLVRQKRTWQFWPCHPSSRLLLLQQQAQSNKSKSVMKIFF